MKRIIVHWTAGNHTASKLDQEHYHFLVQADGSIVQGKFPVEANLVPKRGKYAAHTYKANTAAIGVALCCMAEAVEEPFDSGRAPMMKTQWDAMLVLVASLCIRYNIEVTPQTVLTHAEVSKNLKIPQRGKWDITRLSFDSRFVGASVIGAKLRMEVTEHIKGKQISPVAESPKLADFAPPEDPTLKGTFSMTAEQVGAIVRTVVQLIAGLAIAKGIGDNALWMTIGGGAASIVSGIWSFFWIKKAST